MSFSQLLAHPRSCAVCVFLALSPVLLHAEGGDNGSVTNRLFDFNDAYYQANGVNPTAIVGRRQPTLPLATVSTPPLASENNTRILLTLPAYGASGEVVFWSPIAGGDSTLFTNDAAGNKARQLADKYREFVFPKAGGDPLSLGNVRQGYLFDTRNGYFSNDPLALWVHVFVSYTSAALNTADGQKALADLATKNGYDLDGTPIITSASDIDNLVAKGYLLLQTFPLTSPLHYSVCPIINGPRAGSIAADQFLAYVKKADGTPLEPAFVALFNSLQAAAPQTYNSWQADHFTAAEVAAGLAADAHDFNGDGTTNLLKYALGIEPRSGVGGNRPSSAYSQADGALQLSFTRDAAKADINYVVEASSDLVQWAAIASSTAGAATANLGGALKVTEANGAGGKLVNVSVEVGSPPSIVKRQLLRLRMVRP